MEGTGTGHEHRESHLIRLPSPSPLEPVGKYPHQLHRHGGTAFPPPAAVSPPRCAAQREGIDTRMKSNSVVFAQHEKTAHTPVRSGFGGRQADSYQVDLLSQRSPSTATDHCAPSLFPPVRRFAPGNYARSCLKNIGAFDAHGTLFVSCFILRPTRFGAVHDVVEINQDVFLLLFVVPPRRSTRLRQERRHPVCHVLALSEQN